MRMRFTYFAGSLLLIGLLASVFAISTTAAKGTMRSSAFANKASQPLPALRGTDAVERLKEEGLYSSLAEAVEAADPLIVQQAKLTANDGAAGATFGSSVAISWDTAVIGAAGASVNAPAQGSVHVFVRSGRSWTRQARLTAPGAAAQDRFGSSVAISGNMLVAGAPDDDIGTNVDQGSADVFVRTGSTWSHLQKLAVNSGEPGCHFGASVAINADTVVIGAPGVEGHKGAVYVFALGGGRWSEQQKLAATDRAANDRFGASVAIDADTIVAGAPYHDAGLNADQGAAYVFARGGGTWNQRQKLTTPQGAASAFFGVSVAIDAETIVVGASYHREKGKDNQGSAHVYARKGADWIHQAQLTATDGGKYDAFGSSVAIDTDMMVIGASGAERSRGAAYVFARSGGIWSRRQRLTSGDGPPNGLFGESVAISGDTMMTGTPCYHLGANSNQPSAYVFVISTSLAQVKKNALGLPSGDFPDYSVAISDDVAVVGVKSFASGENMNQGSVIVFARNGERWDQPQKLTVGDGAAGDIFGHSVAIYGNTLVVGAPHRDVGPNANQGAAYVFTRNGESWGTPKKLTASDGVTENHFGWSVAIYADTIVVGAPGDSSVRGAAYVFARSGSEWTQRQRLTTSDAATGDDFGKSVAIYADTIVVGATGSMSPGAAYVFAHNGESWGQPQKLTAGDGAADSSFGFSVAISGDTVAVGSPYDDVMTDSGIVEADRGSIYVFARDDAVWTRRQRLTSPDGAPSDRFGVSVAISGGAMVIGAMGDGIGQNRDQGSAYVFVNRLEWDHHLKLAATDGEASDFFGASVAINGGSVMAVKAPLDKNNLRQGALYAFTYIGCPWIDLDPSAFPGSVDGRAYNLALPGAVAGRAYNLTIRAYGSAPPYRFSLSSGSLPPGMTLSQDGLLSGKPVTAGAYSFTITATAPTFCPGSANYTLMVMSSCPAIRIDTTLSEGKIGQDYSQVFEVAGGTAPYSFKISAGAAPPGLNLSPEGKIYGVPTKVGAFKFTVTATDAIGCAGSRDYTLTISDVKATG